jgi:hypothetical protein
MKLREDYPIYLNPTDKELIELAESNWDSLRVLESSDTLVIASGYGNTHESLAQFYKKHAGRGKTRERWNFRTQSNETLYVCHNLPNWDPFIFFHDHTKLMLCNLGDVSGPERATPSVWRSYFPDSRIEQFRLIAEFSGLYCI